MAPAASSKNQLGSATESDLNASVPWSLTSSKPDMSAEVLLSFGQAYRFPTVAKWSSGGLYRLQLLQALTCGGHHRLTEGSSQLKSVKAGSSQDRLSCKRSARRQILVSSHLMSWGAYSEVRTVSAFKYLEVLGLVPALQTLWTLLIVQDMSCTALSALIVPSLRVTEC